MSSSSSILAAVVALAMITLASGVARSDTLDDECKSLDRKTQASCSVERPKHGEWTLHTGFEVGTGRKASVEDVEARFCATARSAGVPGRVLRKSELPGVLGNGAIMEWQCGLPAVAAAPRAR